MKFCWCTIIVDNMEESLKFYQEIVGLDINRRFSPSENMDIVFLGEGETQIELIYDAHAKQNMGEAVSIGFIVQSVEKMMDFVKQKGIDILGNPMLTNPQVKYFFVKDPSGLRVQFVEQMQ